MRKEYTILSEPTGEEYRSLLRALFPFSRQVLLVVRSTAPLSEFGRQILKELEKDLVLQEKRCEWPGTRLLGHTATVYIFALTSHCLDVLVCRADRLYQWQQPTLPEDLCFLRNEMDPVLTTIAHERDAWLTVSEEEKDKLLSAVPSLKLGADG